MLRSDSYGDEPGGGALGEYYTEPSTPGHDGDADDKDRVKVSYLTSSQYRGTVVHFFQTVEAAQQGIDNVHRQRRTFGLVDSYDYSNDIHVGVTRCVMVSKIEEISLPSHELRVLLGPFTEFDVLCQGSSMLDFIRTIGALFSPEVPGNPMILLQVDERHQKMFYTAKHTSAANMRTVRCNVFRGKLESIAPKKPRRHSGDAPRGSPAGSGEGAGLQPQQVDFGAVQQQQQQQQHQQQHAPPPATPNPAVHAESVNQDLQRKVAQLQEELQLRQRGQDMAEVELRREIAGLRDELRRATSPPRTDQSPLYTGGSTATPSAQAAAHPPPGPPPVWLEPYKLQQQQHQQHQHQQQQHPQPQRSLFDDKSDNADPRGVAHPQYLLGGAALAGTPVAEARHVSPFATRGGGGAALDAVGGGGGALRNPPPGHILQGGGGQQFQGGFQGGAGGRGQGPFLGSPQTPGSIWGF